MKAHFLKNTNSIIKILQEFIVKHWFLLHLGFIVFYALYALYKILFSNSINPLSLDPDVPSVFNGLYFSILCAGFILMAVPIFYGKLKSSLVFVTAFASYILISIGYISSKDKGLHWFGSDVAWGNYSAAMEFKEHGILQGIKTWNERTNPYIENKENNISEPVISFLDKYNLSWIAFNKWKNTEFPEGYDIRNNRPHMHPPLTPVIIALWLTVFPFGHWSAEILMILLEFVSIILVFNLVGSKFKNSSNEIILLIALLTTPVMVLYHNPSGEQLSMLLFVFSVLLIYEPAKAKTGHYLVSGILIGLTFFTKFNIAFYIFIQLIFFIFHNVRIKWKYIMLYFSGIVIVVAAFTLMGYYFWLTIVTGFIYSKLYALYNNVSTFQGLSKLLYFGITIILMVILLIADFKNQSNKLVLTPVLLSLSLLVIYLWDQGTLNRYLTFYLPVLGLFFMNLTHLSELKKKDLLIIPVAGYFFICLNTFF